MSALILVCRFLDVADLIPQLNPGGTGRILKPEFRNMLNKLLFFMDDDEFEKLWQKYDYYRPDLERYLKMVIMSTGTNMLLWHIFIVGGNYFN